MSAFLAVAYPDRIELLTDGAVYEPDGTLTEIRRKVWTGDASPIAVTGRGHMLAVEMMAGALIELVGIFGFDEALRLADEAARRRRTDDFPDHFEVLVAGISETAGPRLHYLTTNGYAGAEPFTMHDVGPDLLGGADLTGEERAAIGFTPDAVAIGLSQVGIPLFEAMRAKTGRNPVRPDLPEHHGIGGQLDWTVITAEGAATLTIHTWPDVIGEKIQPAAAEVMAA